MAEELTKPLTEANIRAATAFYERLDYWKRKNAVLDSLKQRDSELFDPYITLLKVAAINQFYYTNLWAIDRMVDRIVSLHIMSGLYNPAAKEQHAALVENIALLEDAEAEDPRQVSDAADESEVTEDPDQTSSSKQKKQNRQRMHISFASKFAHFFISKEDFPIFDSYAENTLAFHLHWQKRVREKDHLYISYYENVERLLKWAPLSCSFEELDRYLWLTGLYKAWRKQQADNNQKTGK